MPRGHEVDAIAPELFAPLLPISADLEEPRAKAHRYGFGARPADQGGAEAGGQAAIVRAFRDRFPALATLPIARSWGGSIAVTRSFLPTTSAHGQGGRRGHALGYTGHGVAQATAASEILADAITDRANE